VIPGESTRFLTLVVRTRTRNDMLLSTFRREIGKMAYGVPVTVGWWSDSISALTVYRNPRFQTLIFGGFAGLALILTAIGTFSVVSFAVASRTHEMGVRLALGATPRSLVGLMIRGILRPVAAGLVLVFLLTRWLSNLAEAQLFQVESGDPRMLVVSGLVVIAVAILAALLPARRAGRVDPLVVLKAE
jgi:putative ABC transport system permease protein